MERRISPTVTAPPLRGMGFGISGEAGFGAAVAALGMALGMALGTSEARLSSGDGRATGSLGSTSETR